MNAHTPGPWHVETTYAEDTSIAVREGAYGLFIAMVEPHDMEHADALANARLIAAAPELLAAAQQALRSLDEYPSELSDVHSRAAEALRAAIAKAVQP